MRRGVGVACGYRAGVACGSVEGVANQSADVIRPANRAVAPRGGDRPPVAADEGADVLVRVDVGVAHARGFDAGRTADRAEQPDPVRGSPLDEQVGYGISVALEGGGEAGRVGPNRQPSPLSEL